MPSPENNKSLTFILLAILIVYVVISQALIVQQRNLIDQNAKLIDRLLGITENKSCNLPRK